MAYLSQPKVNCFIGEQILNIEQAIEKIKSRQQSKDYLAVQLKQTSQVIGELFFIHEDGTPKYENTLQYAILKKEWLEKK